MMSSSMMEAVESPHPQDTTDSGRPRPGHRHGKSSADKKFVRARAGSLHFTTDNERHQLTTFINEHLASEEVLKHILPIDLSDPDDFFDAFEDGLLLGVLVHSANEDAMGMDTLRRRASQPPPLISSRGRTIQSVQNLNEALQGCKSMGLRLGCVGAEDFIEGNKTIILGVCWQLVRVIIMRTLVKNEQPSNTSVNGSPAPEETPQEPHDGKQEAILLRWFNKNLEACGSTRRLTSIGRELADGIAYCLLISHIDPPACPEPDEPDLGRNAAWALAGARNLGIKGFSITERGIREGDRSMNMEFISQLFIAYPHVRGRPKGGRRMQLPAPKDQERGPAWEKPSEDGGPPTAPITPAAAAARQPAPPSEEEEEEDGSCGGGGGGTTATCMPGCGGLLMCMLQRAKPLQ